MSTDIKKELPWWQKYTLTLNEASEYFGIGYKKLKMFVQDHSDADFVLWNGNRALIKREQFEKCSVFEIGFCPSFIIGGDFEENGMTSGHIFHYRADNAAIVSDIASTDAFAILTI